MSPRTRATLKLLFSITVWGGSFVATKIALREVSPVTVIWLRFGLGVIVLAALLLIRRSFALPTRRELAYFALLGLLGVALHQGLQSTGLKTAQATTSAWIISSSPAIMALLGWLALGERLRPLNWLGILLATFGVLLVASRGDLTSLAFWNSSTDGASLFGDLLVLLSAVLWGIFTVLSRPGAQRHSPARMMFFVMASGWVLICPWFLWNGAGEVTRLSVSGWASAAYLGIFCSGLAFAFWYDGLKQMPAAQVGAFLYIEPFITALVAWFLLGEFLPLLAWAGGAVILLGVWLVQRNSGIKSTQNDLTTKKTKSTKNQKNTTI